MIKDGLLLFISLFFAIGLAEVSVRIWMPQIHEIHPPGMYRTDADVGYVLSPGFRGHITRVEFHTPVHVGQFGLRGRDPLPKSVGTYRILILGDSQAFGFGVKEEETLAVQLESMLARRFPTRAIQVLNGGVPGYGTADQLAFLKSRGKILEPDLVIVQFLSVNDIEESRYPATDWADVRGGMLTSKSADDDPGQALPLWRRVQHWSKGHIHLARLLSDRVGYLAMKWGILGSMESFWGEDFSDEDANLTTSYLVAIAEISRHLGSDCIYLYTTGQAHVFSETPVSLPSARLLEKAAQNARVEWINSLEVLRKRPDTFDLYYPMDGHWTTAGHKAIAELLYDKIIDLNIINRTLSKKAK